MSNRYKGGVISATPPTTNGPYESGAASGAWTLEQQMQATAAGIWPTAGLVPNYIESCFSTWLYTGNGSTQTINNGIDLAGEGGLVWAKKRNSATDGNHILFDTARGQPWLSTNNTSAQLGSSGLINYNSDGFGWTFGSASWNNSGDTFASWTFRKQPKFFDIQTWTGNSTARTIAHNLGSAPGCIIVKAISASGYQWAVYHRSLAAGNIVWLNLTDASTSSSNTFTTTAPTSTEFSLGSASGVNDNGVTYVAYLFAHDAGGFGLTGTDNVISCGSVLGGAEVNLGYEPQWVLAKASGLASNWFILDTMRGFTGDTGGSAQVLRPNESSAESTNNRGYITSTGFVIKEVNGEPYIYIAIRRGPMKVPTDGTSVFDPEAYTGNSTSGRVITTSNRPDLTITKARDSASFWPVWFDRLRGGGQLSSNNTDAELAQGSNVAGYVSAYGNLGYTLTSGSGGIGSLNGSPTYIGYSFTRAPGFFDEVCYTGTGSARAVAHNLTVVPELTIIKPRGWAEGWEVYAQSGSSNFYGVLNQNYSFGTEAYPSRGFQSAPSATQLNLSASDKSNASGITFVAYLFATCSGVSKVGTYSGTGATQTINCGFTGGARFVLIKRTDSTGDWYVWDSARGIVAGNDPYLLLNSTAAEVTSTDYVDTASTGFEISSTAPAAINASGGTFIFLAIA